MLYGKFTGKEHSAMIMEKFMDIHPEGFTMVSRKKILHVSVLVDVGT